jgi:hypothetical protein
MRKTCYIIFILLLVIMHGCKKEEEHPQERLNKDITSGTWKITQLIIDDNNLTAEFEQYRLTFSPDKDPESPQEIFNKLIATDGNNQFQGTWIFIHGNPEDAYTYFISLSFINNNTVQPISARWGIDSHTIGNLRLIKPKQEFSEDTRIMVLKKE